MPQPMNQRRVTMKPAESRSRSLLLLSTLSALATLGASALHGPHRRRRDGRRGGGSPGRQPARTGRLRNRRRRHPWGRGTEGRPARRAPAEPRTGAQRPDRHDGNAAGRERRDLGHEAHHVPRVRPHAGLSDRGHDGSRRRWRRLVARCAERGRVRGSVQQRRSAGGSLQSGREHAGRNGPAARGGRADRGQADDPLQGAHHDGR